MSSEQAPPSPVTAQCFSCKEIREVKDGQIVKTENNRLRLAGSCDKCGKAVSKFVPNPNSSPKVSPSNSPLAAQKKIQKKKVKRQTLKKCAECACLTHSKIIDEQPKKKRKIAIKKALDSVDEALKKRVEELEKHLHLRQFIGEELKSIDAEESVSEVSAQ